MIEAALVAFMGGLPALASSDVPEKTEQQEEKLASAPAPTPAEVTEMREELAAVREAFPRMVATARPPNRADANNVLRWARRAVPDAIPRDVAWFIRGKVDGGQRWRSWGGVVVAAGDYARADAPQTREQNRKNTPQVVEPQYGPSFAEWLAGREATEELEAEWLMA